jgi:hypothetical protein
VVEEEVEGVEVGDGKGDENAGVFVYVTSDRKEFLIELMRFHLFFPNHNRRGVENVDHG